MVRPGSTAAVAAVLRLCTQDGVAMVLQGGNTGMCGAATPIQPGPVTAPGVTPGRATNGSALAIAAAITSSGTAGGDPDVPARRVR